MTTCARAGTTSGIVSAIAIAKEAIRIFIARPFPSLN
jgi:hypothetical protein